jgi:phage shock protein A
MFKQLMTLFRANANAATDELARRNALLILDQQMSDTGAALAQAKRALALAIGEDAQEAARLDMLQARIAGLEERARTALAGGREDLALAAAEAIAELEIDQAAAREARRLFGLEITRLRSSLREAEQRFAALHRGRRLARVGEAVRRSRGFTGALGLNEAEATLDALRQRQALEAAADDAMQSLQAAPRTIELRLGEAGFGDCRPNAAAILARLKPLAIGQG